MGIWDIRAAGFGALVTQLNLNASTEMLYTVQCSEGSRPVIGAAGGERAVGVWEPRKYARPAACSMGATPHHPHIPCARPCIDSITRSSPLHLFSWRLPRVTAVTF